MTAICLTAPADRLPLSQGHFYLTELAQDLLRAVSLSRHLYPPLKTRVSNIHLGSAFWGHVSSKHEHAFEFESEIEYEGWASLLLRAMYGQDLVLPVLGPRAIYNAASIAGAQFHDAPDSMNLGFLSKQ